MARQVIANQSLSAGHSIPLRVCVRVGVQNISIYSNTSCLAVLGVRYVWRRMRLRFKIWTKVSSVTLGGVRQAGVNFGIAIRDHRSGGLGGYAEKRVDLGGVDLAEGLKTSWGGVGFASRRSAVTGRHRSGIRRCPRWGTSPSAEGVQE